MHKVNDRLFHLRRHPGRYLTLVLALLVASCATNPVTGQRELQLVSTAQEIQIGEQQYSPSRQMYGGDYVVDPVLARYVRDVGKRLAAESDNQLPYEFAVVNDSTANAWALPGGKIAVHRGLLVQLNSEAELAAVLGHEIVHSAARHGAKTVERGMLLQGVAVAAAITANNSDYGPLLMTATSIGLQLITQKYGRDAERQADFYGMEYMSRAGYDPAAAVTLQETFVRLSEGRDAGTLAVLFASHPPSLERVHNNEATLAGLPPGGETGVDRYAVAVARLQRTKEAYAAQDRGRKALEQQDTATALAEAKLALQIEPDEAQFHALRGDVRAMQNRWSDALINYNRAVERNPGYFYPLMRRGLTFRQMGNVNEATADLERSIELLPTAPALNTLGEIRLEAGQQEQALELFRAAATSNSPDGRAAADTLLRLELPEKPYRYIKAAVGQNSTGQLILELQNVAPVAVKIQQVVFEYLDANNQVRQVRRDMRGVIQAKSAARQAIDPRWVGGVADVRRVRAAVSRAQIAE